MDYLDHAYSSMVAASFTAFAISAACDDLSPPPGIGISTADGIERLLAHVPPTGFERIRHYGLLASRHKAAKLATCRSLLNQAAPAPAIIESVADFMRRVAGVEIGRCTRCDHGRMQVIAALAALRTPSPMRQATGPPA